MNLYDYMMLSEKSRSEVLTKAKLSDIIRSGDEAAKQEAIDEMLSEGYENLEDE